MEEPKKDESLHLIDTSSKNNKEGEEKEEEINDEERKNNSDSNKGKLILEEKEDEDDDEEEEKRDNVDDKEFDGENEIKEENEGKEEEEEEEENENANLNYDRHFDRELIVGKDYEFKTIQSAINEAKPNNIIKISPGIYRENITIRDKTKIDICSLDNNDQAILLSENSPCMMIYCLEQTDTVQIYNIKFIHRGIRDDIRNKELLETEFFSWHMAHLDNKESYFIYQFANEIEKLEVNYVLDIKIVENIFEENHGNFCAISILKGTVSINNCNISLACLTTETKSILPAIYVENSTAIVENTLIKGNKDYLTIGIYSHDAQLKINECKIFRHRCGGIVSVVNEKNSITVQKCRLVLNQGCGLLIMSVVGKSALKEKAKNTKDTLEINIEKNSIEFNEGSGMILKKCFNAKIIGNLFISNLLDGAELTDCDGFVMMNNFEKNKRNGLVLEAIEESNEAKIFKNKFDENYKNGIDILGNNNKCFINQNDQISGNYLNGIYVHNLATPEIKFNKIFQNYHHGILVENNSSAVIEQNKIYENLRTNISFGGLLTNNTRILENEIYNSRNEGIYIVDAEGGEIGNNKIYNNNEGMILIRCKDVFIYCNEIYKNMRTAILLSDQSTATLLKNEIYENYFIGLLVRDSSQGRFKDNLIRQNVIQFYLSKDCLNQRKYIKKLNDVQGRYEVADYCSIF